MAPFAGDVFTSGDGSATNNPALLGDPCACPLDQVPAEAADAYFDLDWSLALRGAYVRSGSDESFETQIIPAFTATHGGDNLALEVTGSAEAVVDEAGTGRLSALSLSGAGSFQFSSELTGNAGGSLSVTQASPDASGLPAGTATAPVIAVAAADGSLTRRVGQFEVTAKGNLGRLVNGETVLLDTSTIDNSADNSTLAGAGLRLGYQVTPILTLFAEADASYEAFDAASPSLLVYLDGWTYEAKSGVSLKWNEVLSAEASLGLTYRDYDDASLSDAESLSYDASLSYKPDETLTLTGGLTTTLSASAAVPGDSEVEYVLTGEMSYLVNPWLTLRGTAGWHHAEVIGTGDTDRGADLGIGADIATSDHLAVTADYEVSRSEVSGTPGADTQSLMLGVKLSR